jgi:amidase
MRHCHCSSSLLPHLQGLAPLAGSTRDVLGPIAKTTRDAALDLITGFGTPSFHGKAPAGGYTALLSATTLKGQRVGLYGLGWKRLPLSPEIQRLYGSAVKEIEALGATTIRDPFKGSGIANLANLTTGYDPRGTESVANDFNKYLKGLGIASLDSFVNKVGADPFAPGNTLYSNIDALPEFATSLQDPSAEPDLSTFDSIKASYLRIFKKVFKEYELDALVFPHAREILPDIAATAAINETTVSEVNIAGLPLVTVPSTHVMGNGGAVPFSLVFVGPQFSEAKLLPLAHDYEQATHLRLVPELSN